MEKVAPKTVLVIGNGFDKDLQLDTSYQEFLKSEEFNSLKDHNELCDQLGSTTDLWSDLENELGEIAKDEKWNFVLSRENFEELRVALTKYLKRVSNGDLLMKRIIDKILNMEASRHADPTYPGFHGRVAYYTFFDAENYEVFTFNYTDILQKKLINTSFAPPRLEGKYHYVNGCLEKDNIVFGVEDDREMDSKYAFLYKSVQRKDDVDMITALMNADQVIFFGLSFGQTDNDMLMPFFSKLNDYKGRVIIFTLNRENEYFIRKKIEGWSGIRRFDLQKRIYFFSTQEIEDSTKDKDKDCYEKYDGLMRQFFDSIWNLKDLEKFKNWEL